MHGEVCTKILSSEKELLNLKNRIYSKSYSNRTGGFVRPGHKYTTTTLSKTTQCIKVLVHESKWHGTTVDLAGQYNIICSSQELTSPLEHICQIFHVFC